MERTGVIVTTVSTHNLKVLPRESNKVQEFEITATIRVFMHFGIQKYFISCRMLFSYLDLVTNPWFISAKKIRSISHLAIYPSFLFSVYNLKESHRSLPLNKYALYFCSLIFQSLSLAHPGEPPPVIIAQLSSRQRRETSDCHFLKEERFPTGTFRIPVRVPGGCC